MPKILRQNVGGIDYAMAGCALSGSCATAASDFVKVVTLSDGDTVSDGMSLAVAFTNGNTAGNAPGTATIYSSDQVHYFSDSGLTQPFTLAPAGCYTITYTGTGNAYTYKSFPVLSVGGVTAPVCSINGRNIGASAWSAGDTGVFIYTTGKFLLVSVNLDNTTGVLPIVHGGTGRTTAPNIQINLASESSVSELPASGNVAPGVTGTLPIAHGGTNATTAGGACTNLIGALTVATGDVTDNTDIITSNADGYAEQSDKTIYKRKAVKFWNYIKSKIQNVGSLIIGVANKTGVNLTLKGYTTNTNTYADTNPKIKFLNNDESQNISLTFTDYDTVQAPASLTLNGNQGGEYFIAPNFRAIGKFKGVVEGASYRSEAQSSAKLKIKINSTANWMLCFTIVLYQSYKATKIMVSGYQYGNNYWYEPEAVLLGDSNYANAINVYFGYDSANNLWVGLDQGNFTGIAIVDVVNGYKAVSDYSSLFTITSVSSLGGTTQKTVSATTPKKIPIDNTLVNGASGLQFGQFSGGANNPTDDWYHHLYMNHNNNNGYVVDFALSFHSDYFAIRRKAKGSWSNWVFLIHSGNITNYTYGTALCTTASETAAKVAIMRGFDFPNPLTTTVCFPITFTNKNTAASELTLNINGTGAKKIYINDSVSSSSNYSIPAGTYLCEFYGGIYYIDTLWCVHEARNCNKLGGMGAINWGNALSTSSYKFDSVAGNQQDSSTATWAGWRHFYSGLKIAWGTYRDGDSLPITLPVTYTSTDTYSVATAFTQTHNGNVYYSENLKPSDASHITANNSGHGQRWITIGY